MNNINKNFSRGGLIINKYTGLTEYLKHLSDDYHLDLCFNDFSGFLYVDSDLASALQPYLIHKNPFCMKIKSNKELWNRCLKMKTRILDKAEKTKKTYFGMCYCGVYEYVVPIICDDIVIGVIYAGEFQSDKEKARCRIQAVSKEYSMNQDELLSLYDSSTRETLYSPEEITWRLGIVADYIASLYTTLIPLHKNLSKQSVDSYSSEHYILSHAIEYIEQNYASDLNLQKISTFCHCSTSHLSHIFKKNMKINVKAYINKVRIEHAKLLLKNTHHNISEIAINIGFNDPNYFSNTFKEICGMSPSLYRKTYK